MKALEYIKHQSKSSSLTIFGEQGGAHLRFISLQATAVQAQWMLQLGGGAGNLVAMCVSLPCSFPDVLNA